VINYGQATRPWLLVPVGLVYGALYYGLFRFFIARFNLKTPGREDEADVVATPATAVAGGRAEQFVRALGGAANLKAVSACTTRLRLIVGSRDAVDEPALKRLGARGMISPTPTDLQVVLGPIADAVADEIRACLSDGAPATEASADAIRRALGSGANVREVAVRAGRLCIRVARADAVDLPALERAAPRGTVMTGTDTLQLIAGADAEALASALAAA